MNPEQTLKNLQSGGLIKVKPVFCVPCVSPELTETELCTIYQQKRLIGQWFNLSQADVKTAIHLMRLAHIDYLQLQNKVVSIALRNHYPNVSELAGKLYRWLTVGAGKKYQTAGNGGLVVTFEDITTHGKKHRINGATRNSTATQLRAAINELKRSGMINLTDDGNPLLKKPA